MYRQLEEKKLLNSNIASTCPHDMVSSTNGWDRFGSLGHPCKFLQVSGLGLVTATASLNGGQTNFARCLAISCAGTLYTFWRLLPLTEFYQVQNSLCVQVVRSPIVAALLHGTRVVGVSQTFGVEQRAPPIFGRAAITLGISPHSSWYLLFTQYITHYFFVLVTKCNFFPANIYFLLR